MSSWNNPQLVNRISTDIPAIQELLTAAIRMSPEGTDLTPITDIPENAKRLVDAITTDFTETKKVRFEFFDGKSWKSIGKLMHNVDMLDGFHASKTDTSEGIIPVYEANGKIRGGATGEANTAAKFTTARSIDVGGLAESTAQNFDGSNNITIPINHITVQNEADDALNGIVSKAHGGTGNSKGHASDIIITDTNGGTVLAGEYGQIGAAKLIRDVDRKSLVIPGNYISNTVSLDLNFPYNSSSAAHIQVIKSGNIIFQRITIGCDSIWMDSSADNGASWSGLRPISGNKNNLTLYISKSGSDTNTGFSSDLPLATISRAVDIAKLLVPANSKVKFNIGDGNWGDLDFQVPFDLTVAPFDGRVASKFVESLPQFANLLVTNASCTFTGCVASSIIVSEQSAVQLSGYFRTNHIEANTNSVLTLSPSLTLDLISGTTTSAFLVRSAQMVFSKGVTCTALNVLSYEYFLKTELASTVIFWNDVRFSGTVTANKFSIAPASNIITIGEITNLNDFLLGSTRSSIQNGTIINGIPFGTGESNKFLAANHSWKAINPATTSSVGLVSISTGLEVTKDGAVSVSHALRSDLSQKVNSDLTNISESNLLALTGRGISGVYTSKLAYSASSCRDYCTRNGSVEWAASALVETKGSDWKVGNYIVLRIPCTEGGYYISLQRVNSTNLLLPLKIYSIVDRNTLAASTSSTAAGREIATADFVRARLAENGSHIVKSWHSGDNWYRKYSDGFIMQGGKATSASISGAPAVYFPTAFTTTTYALVCAYHHTQSSTWARSGVSPYNKTTTYFRANGWYQNGNEGGPFTWIAMGF